MLSVADPRPQCPRDIRSRRGDSQLNVGDGEGDGIEKNPRSMGVILDYNTGQEGEPALNKEVN